ncbi:ERF family protein, partial [Nostoc sp. NIES-2111]
MDSKNIYQRLHAVMQEVDYVQKEKRQGMRYSIVSHDAVTGKVRPLMVKHGVVYFPTNFKLEQVGNRTQLICSVVFQNIDNPMDRVIVETAGYGIDDQDKGPGKAISYAVKYALLKALGLETGDDPDQDQDVQHRAPTVMVAANGTPGASKAASRAPYDALVKDIRNAASVNALKDWYQSNIKAIDELPPDFVDELRV